MRLAICALLVCCVVSRVLAEDDLYILIEEISLYSCRGVKNEIKISEEDVNIVNEKGNRVYYIKAPGNYSIHFKKLSVKKSFGFLAGEIGVTLQVPVIEGPAGIRFDLPYTIVPETGLLSQQCDANSGIIERNGRSYCRYCDLCGVGRKITEELNKGDHEFLPGENTPQSCSSIDADTYEFKRTISLPDRAALERMIKSKVQGVDDEIKKRFNKGRGRFQVFLNLIVADKPSMSQRRWFGAHQDCQCCGEDSKCGGLSSFYCNLEDCKSSWALQCLHNTARIAACFTVEFNYRLTTQYAEVTKFLRENKFPNQEGLSRVSIGSTTAVVPGGAEKTAARTGSLSERCVSMMPQRLTHLRRYCTIFWNAKLCCNHCQGIC